MAPNKISRQLLAELESLLDREAHDINGRKFHRLPSLNQRKAELVAVCEEALTTLTLGPSSKSVVTALESLKRKAERNAADLQAIRQGMLEARLRIELLIQNQSKSGLYGQKGDEIRDGVVSAVNCSA